MLTRFDTFKLWFAANRTWIGLLLTFLAGFFRVSLSFSGHTETADFLKGVADLIAVGGAGVASAGMFKSDDWHKQNKEQLDTLPPRPTAGLLDVPKPAVTPQRRATDQPVSAQPDRRAPRPIDPPKPSPFDPGRE